jgi:branched-chain amino acid transport system ATP-binding protein
MAGQAGLVDNMNTLFETKDINVFYDKVHVLVDVSLQVEAQSIIALIGANGAGKTTLLRTISGLKRSTAGEIWLEDSRIDKLPPQEIVKLGVVQVPEDKKLFPFMSVRDNLEMGAYLRNSVRKKESLDKVFKDFPILNDRGAQLAGTLSGGEQQMLAMARAMMAGPRLLLLDEPTHGLSPVMSDEISRIIGEINGGGVSIVLVEQNALIALEIAQMGYVLETGRIVLKDTGERLMNNPSVKEAYLGG